MDPTSQLWAERSILAIVPGIGRERTMDRNVYEHSEQFVRLTFGGRNNVDLTVSEAKMLEDFLAQAIGEVKEMERELTNEKEGNV
jgi:hypothetical protein